MKRDYGVVVIARDEERRIGECLAALRDAGEEPVHVVVDSRTVDRTYDVAKKYTPHVRVVEGRRGRLRNEGYRRLGMTFVAFVDADNQVLPGYLGRLRELMNENTDAAIVSGSQIPINCCLLGSLDCDYLNYKKSASSGGSIYRVRAIEEAGGFNNNLNVGEDGDLFQRLVKLGWEKVWTDSVSFRHYYAPSFRVWHHKISHGKAAGPSLRGLARLALSPAVGLHAAFVRREWRMSWYVPLRSAALLLGPGEGKEYRPVP